MTTWEEIRDEVAEMLADGKPLEDVISKLEKIKNEMAKAELIKTIDEMKKHKPITREEWFCSLSTEEKAEWLTDFVSKQNKNRLEWYWWLKQPHKEEAEK